jgi:UDP-N-acetylglucosamine diphosphorylase / glucose-1-phosphate thymidylyltransferase / UDP-N-acetylgalactosamine diphosphorylase / glucosamine-1-phosphate N-acetyltransferase / galactosamine-1-phosphate N-acetyltransferase
MRVCHFEDCHVDGLEPLTLTRPAHDLLCGLTSLADKQRHAFAATEVGTLVRRPPLADLLRRQQPGLAVNDVNWLRAGPAVLVNARWLPPADPVAGLTRPCVGVVGDEVAFVVLGVEHLVNGLPPAVDPCLDRWRRTLPCRPAGGTLARHLWELVDANGDEIGRDVARGRPPAAAPAGVAVVGPADGMFVDPAARIDPMVVADTTGGPVVVGPRAFVSAFTRLEGPCFVGPDAHVFGAKVRAGTSVGPHCRVGGEVEASILLGRSNKYHEGFLGHSYVGEWVNLGAGTHNSDLRNDYGEVTVTVGGRRVETGRSKVGCFLGDHTKTGLGVLLNTGTSAGAFCNLLPCGGYLPKYVPSFLSVWDGRLRENTMIDGLLAAAAKVLARRGQALTDAHAELYRTLLSATALERQRVLRESEQRRLRRSA